MLAPAELILRAVRSYSPGALLLLPKNGIKVEGCFAASLLVFASKAEAEGALRWLMA